MARKKKRVCETKHNKKYIIDKQFLRMAVD